MVTKEDHQPDKESIRIMELAQVAIETRSPGQLTAVLLPALAVATDSPAVLLYVDGGQLTAPECFQYGLSEAEGQSLKDICTEQFAVMKSGGSVPSIPAGGTLSLDLYPLRDNETWLGMIGLAPGRPVPPEMMPRVLKLVAGCITRLIERLKAETQLNHLNAYLTVSSMLAQQMGLQELLETTLYCSMDVVSAEAASILLLGDDKRHFVFYQVEGPTKPALMATTIEADKGIAGSVLQTQQSEVISDVQSDPRFYGNVDKLSGFHTRNMIAVPLLAGEEKIGVLEVINKSGGGGFSEEDHHLMRSIAEEIAFAIRNARVFEYVASTYCKQRQGQPSCKGCSRPLGSWTPCVKYRQSEQFP